MSDIRPLRVTREDLIHYSKIETFNDALWAGIFALVAFLPLSVGTGLFNSLIVTRKTLLLVIWGIFALVFAVLILVRPVLLRRWFVGKDFPEVFGDYRSFLVWTFGVSLFLGVASIVIIHTTPDDRLVSLGLILGGLTYIGMIPVTTTQRILKPNNEARLALLQFVREWDTEDGNDPRLRWLRIGLRQIERILPTQGLSIRNRNTLFLGCCYRIFDGSEITNDLVNLSQWIGEEYPESNSAVLRFLQSGETARGLDLAPAPTLIDRMLDVVRSLPTWLPILITAGIFTLLYFGVPASVIANFRSFLPW